MTPRTPAERRQDRPGRPQKLFETIVVKDAGGVEQPVKRRDAIVERIRATGTSVTLAGRQYGIDADSVIKHCNNARELREKARHGYPLLAAEKRVVEFLGDCEQAFAQWVNDMTGILDAVARGGLVESVVTEEVDPTQQAPGGGPLILKRTVKRTVSAPDVAALRLSLERKAKAEGYSPAVEVTGADGGPVRIAVSVEALAEKLQRARELRAVPALEAGDTSTNGHAEAG